MIRFVIITLLLFSCGRYYNTRSNVAFEKADLFFSKNDYEEAARYYLLSYSLKKDSKTLTRLALCMNRLGKKEEELKYLQQANAQKGLSPKQKLHLADLFKFSGNTSEAINIYLTLSIEDTANAAYYKSLIDFLTSPKVSKTVFKGSPQLLPNINSVHDEVLPFIIGDTLLFSSNKTSFINNSNETYYGQAYFKVYQSKLDTTAMSECELPKESEVNKLFKEHVNLSGISIIKGGRKIYFSSSSNKKSPTDSVYRLKMYTVARDSTGGSWSKPHTFIMNKMPYSFAQPYVMPDESMFFFASDMPRGYGGTDIWVCFNIENKWSDPVNLGPIVNSPGNEIYPFYHSNGKLYFASDYHPGYGGWDIMEATEDDGEWTHVLNAGPSINSSADEICIFINPKQSAFYFSSNRDKGKGGFDLYVLKK
jgi:hypothetical protein